MKGRRTDTARDRHIREDWQCSALWRSMEDMRIEPQGAPLGFVARLGHENGWNPVYAKAVFAEYRRFLYLAATSGRPVTPSEDVDQVWHLHLSYTRHYWDVLCARILGRPLHHEPTAGGRDEAARYRGQYEATLWLYRDTFGTAPPADIWPDAGIRFAVRSQRVDRSRYWLVPKLWSGRGAALATSTTLLGACTMLAANDASAGGAVTAIILIVVIAAVVVGGIVAATRSSRKKDEGGGCGGGASCSGDSSDGGSGCGGGCGS